MPNPIHLINLRDNLNKAVEDFRQAVTTNYETSKGQYCTADDLDELARETFYALNDFKSSIIRYLQAIEKYI